MPSNIAKDAAYQPAFVRSAVADWLDVAHETKVHHDNVQGTPRDIARCFLPCGLSADKPTLSGTGFSERAATFLSTSIPRSADYAISYWCRGGLGWLLLVYRESLVHNRYDLLGREDNAEHGGVVLLSTF